MDLPVVLSTLSSAEYVVGQFVTVAEKIMPATLLLEKPRPREAWDE